MVAGYHKDREPLDYILIALRASGKGMTRFLRGKYIIGPGDLAVKAYQAGNDL